MIDQLNLNFMQTEEFNLMHRIIKASQSKTDLMETEQS